MPPRRTKRKIKATMDNTSDSKKQRFKGTTLPWKEMESMIYMCHPLRSNSCGVAGFDVDETIISTSSGRTFSTGEHDWQFLYDVVPAKIKEISDKGYNIVFFTNQKGISTGKVDCDAVLRKFEAIISQLKVPVSVFIATEDDHYRKPSPLLWDKYCELCGHADSSISFYVGDAAGRPKGWQPGAKKDFSASDRKFAININVSFLTPEECFLGQAKCTNFDLGTIDPHDIPTTGDILPNSGPIVRKGDIQELVLFVGLPASGKSTFYKRHFAPHGYTHINRDTLHTKEKCLKVTLEALNDGKSVVIDNTNPGIEDRSPYVNAAAKKGVPVRCFHFKTGLDVALHLNRLREKLTKGGVPHVPTIAFNMCKKKWTDPSVSEGIKEIITVNFVPSFDDEKQKKLFYELS